TAPIIRNTQVQNALASSVNQQLFKQVDVNQVVSQALPPRAGFLAPTITDQVHQHSQQTILKIVQRPQFQNRWNAAQKHAHDHFIRLVDEHGSDGSIDVGEVYTDVSQQLQGTNLAFLANKPLPSKVGRIQLVQGEWLTMLQRTIQNIDTWRLMAIGLLVIFGAFGIWLSRRRRQTAIILGSLFALAMFLTLIAIRIGKELVGDKVSPQYAEAARQTYSILAHGLVMQTVAVLSAALAMILIVWISGPSKGSHKAREVVDHLFSGKLHAAMFSKENGLTRWVGAHKAVLQWLAVTLVAASLLFARLTAGVLIAQLIILGVLVLAVEILAAKPR
ncbi:MAG TPA: hypothetical protein VN554_02845, partial [Verrucomicrobiae bacterium]|nr:hypothetical protein [Verrucomicrobiae bacterium]